MYSQEEREAIYDTLCAGVAEAKSLRAVCDENKDKYFPSLSTIMKWLGEDANFSERYARAREEQADFLAQQIVEIADAPVANYRTLDDDAAAKALAEAASRADMERRRQQIDARKWVAAKLKPKAYGDKLELGGNLGVTLNDEQLDARLALLLGKAGASGLVGGAGAQESGAEAIRSLPARGTA